VVVVHSKQKQQGGIPGKGDLYEGNTKGRTSNTITGIIDARKSSTSSGGSLCSWQVVVVRVMALV